MDVSIAYQGGGARVVELIAAVKACTELEQRQTGFHVLRVTGASAGAIAAAIHATGCDIDAIVRQSDKLKKIIQAHFDSRQLSKRRIAWRLFRGLSVFEEGHLLDAITEIFKLGGIDALQPIYKVVRPGRQLRIVLSDIRTDSSEVATEGSHSPLANVLLDSCAIPFAFRVPGSATQKAHILDGGLFQNLPAREALKELVPGQVALGISFEGAPTREVNKLGLGGYAAAILSSLLGERVKDAGTQIKESNIVRLQSDRGTFDFSGIFDGDFHEEFNKSVDYCKTGIDAWINNTQRLGGVDWSSTHPADLIEQQRQTDQEVLEFLHERGEYRFKAKLLHHEVVFQSGINQDLPDIYHIHIHLDGDENVGLQFIQFWFYDLENGPLKRTRVQVRDSTGIRNVMVLPIRPQGKTRERSSLLCLDRPLRCGDVIEITKTEETFNGMLEYVREGFNFEGLTLKPGKAAEEMRITVHFPREMQPQHVRDASTEFERERKALEQNSGRQLLTRSKRMDTLRDGCISWVSVVEAVQASQEPQFVKVVYDKGRA